MTRRERWLVLAFVALLISGPFLKDLAAKSVDRFAIWDSTLTNPVVVTNTTPGGSDYAAVVRFAGTVPAAQSGTWTVQPGNTANTTPWLIGGTVQPGNTPNTTPWLTKPHDGTNPLMATAVVPAAAMANPLAGWIKTANMCADEGTSPLTWSPCVLTSPIAREVTILAADGAQTDVSLVGTIATGSRVVVTKLTITMDASNSGTVACRVGFGAATIPAASLAGTNGIVQPRVELNAREGIVNQAGGRPIGKGADGEELRATCDSPAAGAIYIGINYYTVAAN